MMNIALSKGRVEKNFIDLLNKKNIMNGNLSNNRSLKIKISDEYSLLIVKATDVVNLVSQGYADIGVVGSDVIEEENNERIKIIYDLESGKCYFALSTLPGLDIESIKTVATKYPNITRKLLEQMKLECNIVKMNGSLEIAPLINYSDAIVDIVETGTTLKENGLVERKRLESISTKIITVKDNDEISRLIRRIK